MQEANWLMTGVRGLFAGLNYCIYSLIEFIMQGMFDIANLKLTEGLIGDIYNRIYAFLAIFMVFKLTISFFKYLVNPDSMLDKEKGAGKLISRVVVMLALVIILPMVFPYLDKAQETFIPMLPKVILGQANDNSGDVSSNANLLASTALSAFYTPCSGCTDAPDPIGANDDAVEIMMSTYGDKLDGYYAYNFNFFMALVVGIVIVLILISMTIKIGIRLFKMFILEMIAPIPVMSYIDPKSSKDGAFASWTKQLTSTFLDIFVRLGIIYVVLLLLSALANDTLLDPATLPTDIIRKGYLYVFLIIALLMFAKDAPNFVKDALGIKHDKDTSGALAAVTGGILGAGTGAVSGAISGRGLRGAITGAASGLGTGFQGGMTGKKGSAWSAAGDAALQARTGDSKAKSGVLAALQSSATKAQLSAAGKKLNISDATADQAKNNMIEMKGIATEARDNWTAGNQTGHYVDLMGNDVTEEKARQIMYEAESQAAIAESNYSKMDKANDTYNHKSYKEKLDADKKAAKPDYKRGRITKASYKAKGRANPEKAHVSRDDLSR